MPRVLAAFVLIGLAVCAPAPADAAARGGKAALKPFASCNQVAAYGQRHAQRWRPIAAPVAARPVMPVMDAPVSADGAGSSGPVPVSASAPAAERGTGGEDFSLTNNQEAGVFEADSVKTDGRYLFAAENGRVNVVDTQGGTPRTVGSVALGTDGAGARLLLRGNRLLAMTETFAAVRPATSVALGGVSRTVLHEIDITDPAAPELRRTVALDGSLLAARRIGGSVRLVLQGAPAAEVTPQANPAAASSWLPKARYKRAGAKRARTRKLVRCNAVRRPRAFSGLTTTTVVTLDVDSGLDPIDADTIVAGGETVYASGQNLFVASQDYRPGLLRRADGEVPRTTTAIHRFAIDDPRRATYKGSGTVPGFLLSQFSLSDRAGVLRVASTEVPPWFGDTSRESESHVTTLRLDETAMPQLGQVSGLGPDERIYSVRFLDTEAFVVTFRQVDPLYAVDLRDPAAPRVAGELKLPGYSAYLHPLGPGRLLGIGQDADERGRTKGTQVSLFDVSDLAQPRVLQQAFVGGGSSSAVESDHLAFLHWSPRNLVVFPLDVFGDSPRDFFSGAIGFTVGDGAITEAGRVQHPGGQGVSRSVVVGDVLYTVSARGVAGTRMDGWGDAGFAAFQGAG